MLKVGLIGAGMIGGVHAEAYASVRGMRLVGVADNREDAARRLGGKAGVPSYTSMQELIQAENPDVIDICLPTDLHKDHVIRAAQLGKHVFCEKPIAPTVEDAIQMTEACRKAGVKFMIGHVLRFSPDYLTAKRLVEEGKLGKVGTVRMVREGAMPSWSGWFADKRRSGGVLLDLAIHDLDWLRWVFGDVERVYAKTATPEQGITGEHAFVSIRMKSGLIAHMTGSWAQPDGFRSYLELAGTGGVATLDSDGTASIRVTLRGEGGPVRMTDSPLERSAYADELQHFADCIESDTEPLVNGEEAAKTLKFALAAIESAETGQAVHLE